MMKNIHLHFIYLIFLLFGGVSFSETNHSWSCYAEDASHKQWSSEGSYQREARNQAFDACKKQSETPATCITAKESCELFINGVSTRPLWRCSALDFYAQVWRSAIYTQQYDALLGAKAFCHQHSRSPGSCYAYVMMCNNLNEG